MKIGIVTGASSGLGKEFALQLENECDLDEIWLIARRKDLLKKAADELSGAKGIVIPIDITSKDDIKRLKKKIISMEPDIKILVNNAGYGLVGEFSESSMDRLQKMIDLNVKALVEITGLCVPYMNEGGLIVQVASIMGVSPGMPCWAVYGASKAFVISFSNALYSELKNDGIHVIAVTPGPLKTEFAKVAFQGKTDFQEHGADSSDVVKKAFVDARKKRIISTNNFFTKIAKLQFEYFNRKFSLWLAHLGQAQNLSAEKYFTRQKDKLQKDFNKILKHVKKIIAPEYGSEMTEAIIKDISKEYENLIPLFPNVGGRKIVMMSQKIIFSGWCLALYRVLKRRHKPLEEIGGIIYKTVEKDYNSFFKKIQLRLNGMLTFSKLYLKILKNISKESQKKEYPESGVLNVVDGDGKDFNIGFDFIECPTQKFFHAQNADEILPYICYTDYLFSRASGTGLVRTTSLGEGGDKCDFRLKKGRKVKQAWPPEFLKQKKSETS